MALVFAKSILLRTTNWPLSFTASMASSSRTTCSLSICVPWHRSPREAARMPPSPPYRTDGSRRQYVRSSHMCRSVFYPDYFFQVEVFFQLRLDFAHLLCHQVILVPWEMQPIHQAAPGVECPVAGTDIALVIDDECRPAVANP